MFFSEGWNIISSEKKEFTLSKIVGCYEIKFNNELLFKTELFSETSELPEIAKKKMNSITNFFPSIYNVRKGSQYIALGSILYSSSLFDASKVKENKVYLYIFESSYPVFVSFRKGEGKAILANSSFIFAKELINADEDGIKKTLSQFEHLVVEIKSVKK